MKAEQDMRLITPVSYHAMTKEGRKKTERNLNKTFRECFESTDTKAKSLEEMAEMIAGSMYGNKV